MADGNAASSPEPQQKGVSPTIWSAAVALVLMGALVAILAIVVDAFPSASDASSILGIVVPAIVSLGAAAFGVAVAYNAVGGKADAEAGKADAQAKQQSAEDAKQETAATAQGTAVETLSQINALQAALQRIIEPVTEASSSPTGERDLLLQPVTGAGAPLKVRTDDIGAAEASIAAARSNLEGLMRGIPT